MSSFTEHAKNWLFTWNNPDYDQEPPNVWPNVRYAVWQHEVGEQGTPHFQGYVVLHKAQRISWLVKNCPLGIHWEPRRGTHEQAKAYCTKEESRTHGPWVYGEDLAQGKRNDLTEVAKYLEEHSISEAASEYPAHYVRYERGLTAYRNVRKPNRTTHTQLIIFWGPPGTGKSSRVRELWPDAYWLQRGRSGEPWWCGYDSQDTVIIDEFYGWIGVDTMSRLIDQFPMQVEAKGKTMKFTSERVVVISNKSPWEWWSCELHGMRRRLEEAVTFHVTSPIWLQPPAPTPTWHDQVAAEAERIRSAHDRWVLSAGKEGQSMISCSKLNPEGLDEDHPLQPYQ